MGKPAIRFATFWLTGEGIRMYLMLDHTGKQIVIVITIWWYQKLGSD
jgi:hypothetical protein